MKKTNLQKKALLCLVATAAIIAPKAYGQAFADNFDVNSSASWTNIFTSTTNIVDASVLFAFDYGTNKYVRFGVTNTIPSAPNSAGGTTKGLKIFVNKNDALAAPAAVCLFPKGKTFSDNYALKVDVWMNYNGGAYGGVDSTEQAGFGLNHAGTGVAVPTNVFPNPTFCDGTWFLTAGEGGTDPDLRCFVGNGTAPLERSGAFPDRDGDSAFEQNATEAQPATHPLKQIFPGSSFESPGAPGKQWVQVELRQYNNTITWIMNGFVIAETTDNALNPNGTTGNVMLSYMDLFSGIPSPKEDVFIIYDNVRVFTNIAQPTLVSVANILDGSEPANAGTFRITRTTGNNSQPLTVNYQTYGTAKAGIDYVTPSGTAVIPGGQDFVDVNITPIDDLGQESSETIVMALKSGTNYDVSTTMIASQFLNDDGDTQPVVNAGRVRDCYELHTNRPAVIEFYTTVAVASDLTVNYTISGTATNGSNYTTIGTTATILAGNTNVQVLIYPKDDNTINSNRTVILTLATGAGYGLGDLSATNLIRNDDLQVGTVLFSDNFDTNTSASWSIFRTKPADRVDFAYDYSNITNDLPSAPHSTNGTRKGLRIEVNAFAAGAVSGVSVSPIGKNFTGDYRLRFDGWNNYNAPLEDGGSQSTEWLTAGIGTSGTHLQSDTTAGGVAASLDGVWFALDGDHGNGTDVRAVRNSTKATVAADPGVYAAGSQNTETTPYYFFMEPVYAPLGQQTIYATLPPDFTDISASKTDPGNSGFAWRDWVITKKGGTVTWEVDGILMATLSTNGATISSNIFVGAYDPTATINSFPDFQYMMIDNLVVESLTVVAPTTPVITSVASSNNLVVISFTGATTDVTGSFSVVATPTVHTTFSTVEAATVVQVSPGVFKATVTPSGAARYYRIRR